MQLSSMKENLDNIFDKENISESSREYVKSMMLSNSFIDAYKLYKVISEPNIWPIFSQFLKNEYIKNICPSNTFSFIYAINTASGQYLVADKFALEKITLYQLSNKLYMKVIELSDRYTGVYITNWKSVIIFHLEYDEQNKTLKINNKNVIPSPLIKPLSRKEEEDIVNVANTYFMLHVIK